MKKTLTAHKEELLKAQEGQKLRLQNQFGETKDGTTKIAKLALIGGASVYVGIKLTGFVVRKVFGKKKKNEPQIVYVQTPEATSISPKTYQKATSKKSFWKGIAASTWAILLPLATSYAKKEGGKIAEKELKKLLEKYKDQIPMDKLEKLGLDKLFKS